MAAAALVVFAAVLSGAGGGSTGHFVVASRSLQAGSLLEPADLSVESLHLPSAVAQSSFTDPGRLVGRQLAVPVSGGELVEASMLTSGTGPHLRPVTVPIDPASLGSLIPGQPVDVLETAGASGSPTVAVVLRGATLLEVSKGSSGFLSSAGSAVVTIGVTNLGEVEAVLEASRAGTITLVAAEPSDGVGPGSGAPTGSPPDGGPSTTGGASG